MQGEGVAASGLEVEAARRRHPAERWMSRYTGLLLLLIMTQGAFGYALVGLTTAAWVRDTHFVLGLGVVLVAFLTARAARRLPAGGRRVAWLRSLAGLVSGLSAVVLVLGLIVRGWIPARDPEVGLWHLGIGILLMFLVALVHIVSIGPSILLSARRERDRLVAAQRPDRPS